MEMRCLTLIIAAFCLAQAAGPAARAVEAGEAGEAEAICLAIMDPLAARLSCPCVAGYAQRDYQALAAHLEQQLGRPVRVGFGESIRRAVESAGCTTAHVIIGKHSVVKADAQRAGLTVEPVAALTDLKGDTVQRGLFVVPADDPAESIAELIGYELYLGPAQHSEKHIMPLAALREAEVPRPSAIHDSPSCSDAAAAILDVQPPTLAAAVISSYAQPLLEGCGAVPKGSLKVVGSTPPVRFITAFVTGALDFNTRDAVRVALLGVASERPLCRKLESARGFVPLPDTVPVAWSGWRGPTRAGLAPALPRRLSETPDRLWSRPLARTGLGGVAATAHAVLFGDRDDEDRQDVFRCLHAASGKPLWTLAYDAPGNLDYGNSPRATPLVENGRVHMLGAFGDLHCVDLASGKVLWKRSLVADFHVPKERLSAWGYCGSPLVADGRLIVSPGAADASLVALDPATGHELWRCPGEAAGHGSFIAAECGGVRQVIGHDASSLGGWSIATGQRLWTLRPPVGGDFNVPTPVLVGDRLLVSTEMNGTRLHAFRADGTIEPEPVARSDELSPDMSTPVAVGDRVFGVQGRLIELDAANGLAVVHRGDADRLDTYAAVVAGPASLLVIGNDGMLMLYDIFAGRCRQLTRCEGLAQDGTGNPVYSHPALVGTRLYIRGDHEITCLELAAEGEFDPEQNDVVEGRP